MSVQEMHFLSLWVRAAKKFLVAWALLAGCASLAVCPRNQWCNTWPPSTGPNRAQAPYDSGWNLLVYGFDRNEFYLFGDDEGKVVTFENAFISYRLQQDNPTENPWKVETTCGEGPATPFGAINGSYVTLKSRLPKDEVASISLDAPSGLGRPPYPGKGTLIVGDEAIDYGSCENCTAASTAITLNSLSRGRRTDAGNSTASDHPAGTLVHLACPAPRANSKSIIDHPITRHPVRETAYDPVAKRIWQVGGYQEAFDLTDTWYYCLAESSSCPASKVNTWTRVLTRTAAPPRKEAALAFDPEYQALILYGGMFHGVVQDETWIFCTQPNARIGCAEANTWNRVSTKGNPGRRHAHTMRYDSANHKILLFGGVDENRVDCKTFGIYDVAMRRWVSHTEKGDTPAHGIRWPAFAYDSNCQRAVIYTDPHMLYTFDPVTYVWKSISPPSDSYPEGTINDPSVSMDYDSQDDTFVLIQRKNNSLLSTWELPGSVICAAPHAAAAKARADEGVRSRIAYHSSEKLSQLDTGKCFLASDRHENCSHFPYR